MMDTKVDMAADVAAALREVADFRQSEKEEIATVSNRWNRQSGNQE